jgi:hypothetical protein
MNGGLFFKLNLIRRWPKNNKENCKNVFPKFRIHHFKSALRSRSSIKIMRLRKIVKYCTFSQHKQEQQHFTPLT